MNSSTENGDSLTLDDFLRHGRLVESGIRMTGEIWHSDHEASRAPISECRHLAIGITVMSLDIFEDLRIKMAENLSVSKEVFKDRELGYIVACLVAFAQGATVSSTLITHAQYMKAAAVLKQDIELLARLHEIAEGSAIEGKTPNVSRGPEDGRRAYGMLNKLAHPSNLDEMYAVLSFPDGHYSINPIRRADVESSLYRVHVWNCIQVAEAATNFLSWSVNQCPPNGPAEKGLGACIEALAVLSDKAAALWS